MQVFRVTVAHRETGASEVLDIEASSADAAAQIANDQGWLVEQVTEAPPVFASVARGHVPNVELPSDLPSASGTSVEEQILAELRIIRRSGIVERPAWTITRGLLLFGALMFVIGITVALLIPTVLVALAALFGLRR